ncbi:secretagogin-like [Osmerus eperlanus]|uniref:secretagogin-like n=1 Tax=Osmerus eperlanus TaxID=29151 RepID=UPI002E0FFFBB
MGSRTGGGFRKERAFLCVPDKQEIWRKYDADSSGYISAVELKSFLNDLFLQQQTTVSSSKLEEYTDAMMKIFYKNKDGCLDLNDLARILSLEENFLLEFKLDVSPCLLRLLYSTASFS